MPQTVFLNEVAGSCTPVTLLKKRVRGTGVFCEFCGIFKNTFLHETPPVDASKTGLSASKSRTLLDFLCNEEEKDLHFGKYQLQDLKV